MCSSSITTSVQAKLSRAPRLRKIDAPRPIGWEEIEVDIYVLSVEGMIRMEKLS